jgi:hypothetical protein
MLGCVGSWFHNSYDWLHELLIVITYVFNYVDVDNEYIAVSASWTLPTPVPWHEDM